VQPDPERLFFIVGTGRCGSTLLQAMLTRHPNLYIPAELRYFGRHEPGLRFTDPLRDEHVEAYLARWLRDPWWEDVGMDAGAFQDAVRGGLRTSRDIYLWILGHVAALRGNGQRRCGEKTPYYALFAQHIAELFPGARFIHLYRDPRDVAASYLEQYWIRGGTALRVSNYLMHVFRRVEQAAKHLGPERLCAVKYEELVDHPERELRRLCAFLGEDYDPAMLQFAQREEVGYLEVEEDWKGMTRQELTRARVGRYRARLTPRQVWTVERRLGSVLPQIGYEPTSTAPAPIHWHGLLWAERFYRKALRTLGLQRWMLDEQAVLSRRNRLLAARRKRPATGESG
jgi:sulfotransferase family protein